MMTTNLMKRVEELQDTLEYALSVIENYAMDIHQRKDLLDEGFCQGSMYRRAPKRISEVLYGSKSADLTSESR